MPAKRTAPPDSASSDHPPKRRRSDSIDSIESWDGASNQNLKVYVVQAKLDENEISEIYNLIESHASREGDGLKLQLSTEPDKADVIITNVRMPKRLERHLDWRIAVGIFFEPSPYVLGLSALLIRNKRLSLPQTGSGNLSNRIVRPRVASSMPSLNCGRRPQRTVLNHLSNLISHKAALLWFYLHQLGLAIPAKLLKSPGQLARRSKITGGPDMHVHEHLHWSVQIKISWSR